MFLIVQSVVGATKLESVIPNVTSTTAMRAPHVTVVNVEDNAAAGDTRRDDDNVAANGRFISRKRLSNVTAEHARIVHVDSDYYDSQTHADNDKSAATTRRAAPPTQIVCNAPRAAVAGGEWTRRHRTDDASRSVGVAAGGATVTDADGAATIATVRMVTVC
jgi:hypothetical protein